MNHRGFVALMDAVIFTAVLMLALSATIGLGLGESADERDAGAMLDGILYAEVRMSDLVEDGDGTPVRVSDLCALMLSTGQPGVREYLVEVNLAHVLLGLLVVVIIGAHVAARLRRVFRLFIHASPPAFVSWYAFSVLTLHTAVLSGTPLIMPSTAANAVSME